MTIISMKFLWRAILVASLAAVGMCAGAFLGATYLVPKGSGLAGGAMVLGYAALGIAVCAIVGLVVASQLEGRALRNVTLAIGIPVLVGSLLLAAGAFLKQAAEREPDSAFAAAGDFTVVFERLDTSDPYLFVSMEINSRDRTWTQTGPAPDHKTYYAAMKAEHLIEIREALDKVAAMRPEDLADCESGKGPATKRLRWNLIDAQIPGDGPGLVKQGAVSINAACLQEYFVISRAVGLVEKASQKPGGRVKEK